MEPKRLFKSRGNRVVCGVCGGLGEYFNVDPTLLRLAVVLGACVSCGTVLIGYFVAAVVVPEQPQSPME